VTLEVSADDGGGSSDQSISLGLIVTELVINCLKHAFPGDRHGRIAVDYQSRKDDWTLTVRDDGVGMRDDLSAGRTGLGTSIVAALARKLEAEVTVSDAQPGTQVVLVHRASKIQGRSSVEKTHRIRRQFQWRQMAPRSF
jgi:two-component sensor histidine kinase